MKVLMINGSPKADGCISEAFKIAAAVFAEKGIAVEEVKIGSLAVRGCTACLYCKENGRCVFDDIVNETAPKLAEADGLILGSPVYYGNPNGTLLSFMQRLLYSSGASLHMKVGASIVSCRRGGNSATFEALNQFFGISGMPVASSVYWNDVHGYSGEDVRNDEEGSETIRVLAENMAYMMKAINETGGRPQVKKEKHTNFMR